MRSSWGLHNGTNCFIRRGRDQPSTFALSDYGRHLPPCEAGERPSPDAHTMLLGSTVSRIIVLDPYSL